MSDKKKVAAISAVMRYMRQQEETYAFEQTHTANGRLIPTAPQVISNAWGMSGRQAQMTIRNLMQMKALNRLT
jgi:hypothetical protein